jgi:ABC-type amino acid transport substrate-binding protein
MPSSSRESSLIFGRHLQDTPTDAFFARSGRRSKAIQILRIVAQVPDDPRPLGIGLGKNQPGLLAAVNGALGAMRRDGSLNQLKKK